MFEKPLTLFILNRTAPGGSPIKLLASGAVSVIAIAFAVALLIALTGAAGLVFFYHTLLSHGVNASTVVIYIYTALAVILAVLVWLGFACIAKITDIPANEDRAQTTVTRYLNHMLSGFGDGLLTRRR